MAATRTLAFVIKTKPYRDTSLLATFYTRDMGKLKAIVKGVRDGRYRYGSTLEPFSLNEILVYRRKRGDLHLVTGAELVERYDPLRLDLEKLGASTYLTEIIDQLTDDGHANDEIHILLERTLNFLETAQDTKRVCRIFEIKLAQILGLLPELNRCVKCTKARSNPVHFSVPSGGILCDMCRKKKTDYSFLVPMEAVIFLEEARRGSFEEMMSRPVSRNIEIKIEKIMRSFLDFHLSYKPRSLIFLEKIRMHVGSSIRDARGVGQTRAQTVLASPRRKTGEARCGTARGSGPHPAQTERGAGTTCA